MSDSPPPSPNDVARVLNDRDLLRRFVQDSDEAAFEQIVRRHQGLVIGVCRRVLGNSPDVDDAFQVTFLTLARRPRQVRNALSLSTWLYTVAWRTSWRIIRQRRKHSVEPLSEHPEQEHPGPLDQIASAQDCLVLDEELNSLPTKYREVLVMTYFAGQGSQQIADELNVSKGTIDGRIREARNHLRVRLARRGVTIGVLAVAAGLSAGKSAAASPTLLNTTLQLGTQTLSGSIPGTTDLSHLEPFIRAENTMITSKLLLSAVVCFTAIAGLAGMNGLLSSDDEASAGSLPVSAIRAQVTGDGKSGDSLAGDASRSDRVEVSATTSRAEEKAIVSGNGHGGRRFEYYPVDATPTERWMYEMLENPIPPLDFPGETPLSEVLDALRFHCSETYGAGADGEFSLTLFSDRKELELERISSLEEVMVHDISFPAGMELQNALKLIFDQTHDPAELTYEIRNEVMVITTVAKATSEDALVTRVYEVGDLLDLEYQENWNATTKVLPSPAAEKKEKTKDNTDNPQVAQPVTAIEMNLAALAMRMTSPPHKWFDVDGEGGALQIVGQTLVVRQTQSGHREIVRLLNMLSESLPKTQ